MKYIVSLDPEVEKFLQVPLVGAAPPVVVYYAGEGGTAEHRRDVIKNRPQQSMRSIRITLAVVIVQFADQPQQLRMIEPPGLSPPKVCAPVVGNVLVYSDRHHLTWPYSKSTAPFIERLLLKANRNLAGETR